MKTVITTNKGRITSGKTDKKTAAAIVAAAVRRGKKAAILAALLIIATAATCQTYGFTVQSIGTGNGVAITKPAPVKERFYTFTQDAGALYTLRIDGKTSRVFRKKLELPNRVEFFAMDKRGGGVEFILYKDEQTNDHAFATVRRFDSDKVLYLYKD